MRIVSSFKDYYDSVQNIAQDHELLYIREEKEEELQYWDFPRLNINLFPHAFYKVNIIGFCDVIYPIIDVFKYDSKSEKCVNVEDFDEYVENLKDKSLLDGYYGKNVRRNTVRRPLVVNFFEECERQKNSYKHLFKGFPIFLAGQIKDWKPQIVFNARLKGSGFERIKGTYDAFQEISMFLGNLAAPEKFIPAVSDEDMIAAKGFDRFSFRKDKK